MTHSARGSLWVISAPSGAGKTSLTRALVPYLAERDVPACISVSYTTRAPRPGEEDGVHYHFVNEPTFAGMVERGEFLEHAEVFGRRYGTGRAATEALLAAGNEVLLDIDWQGGRQVRAEAPHATSARSVFILPPSQQELERRLRARAQDSDATIGERMRQARAEISHWDEYEYLIVNEAFERALGELAGLILAVREGRAVPPRRYPELVAELLAG